MNFWKRIGSSGRLLALGVALFSSVSCVTNPQTPSTFWNDKNAKVAVMLSVKENRGQFTQISNNVEVVRRPGIENVSEADAAMGTVKADEFRSVRQRFVSELRRKGFRNVVEVSREINWRNLPHRGGMRTGWMAGADFSGVVTSQDADYVIVLSLEGYGAARNYVGIIPAGPAWGSSGATGVMVDRKGTLVWASDPVSARVDLEGDWKQPPGYPNLKKAAREAMKQSADSLFGGFFQQ
jgi:hypothetical protein